MLQVKIKTDNIEVNVSSEDEVIDTEDFLYSMKKIMDMVVEAENDIAYNNETEETEFDWDAEEQNATFHSIMSKANLSGTAPTQNPTTTTSYEPSEKTMDYILNIFNKIEQSR
jgi:hypothetical protein